MQLNGLCNGSSLFHLPSEETRLIHRAGEKAEVFSDRKLLVFKTRTQVYVLL